jgi:hypothetical protein
MAYDQDVDNLLNGTMDDGRTPRAWAWVRVRARKVLGDITKKQPFSRDLGQGPVAATPSMADHLIGTAEQVSWRYVDSAGNLWDLGDFALFSIERALSELGPAKVAELRTKAGQLRPWPPGAPGAPSFEVKQ